MRLFGPPRPTLEELDYLRATEIRANDLARRLDQQMRTTALGIEFHNQAQRQAQERIDRLGRLLAAEIRAHDETKRVLAERQDQAGRVQYLERELKDMEQSRLDLANVADARWNELLALKAKRRKR